MTQRSVKKFFGLAILLAIMLSIVPMASADLFVSGPPSVVAGGSETMPVPVAAPAPPADDSSFEFWMILKPFLFGIFF